MMVDIYRARMSFIWMERFPTLLLPRPGAHPMEFISNEATYRDAFRDTLAAVGAKEKSRKGLMPPWEATKRNYIYYFWYYYLAQQIPEEVSPAKAWKFLVPFRDSGFARIDDVFTAWPSGKRGSSGGDPAVDRVSLEAFYYPHCFGLLATVYVEVELVLDELVDKLIELRRRGRYQIIWPEGSLTPPRSLDAAALELLGALRQKVLGKGAEQGDLVLEPLSIVTFVDGEVEDVDTTELDEEIHRALQGLCNWNRHWRTSEPHDLDECSLKIQEAQQGHLLYQYHRGRAVWFPGSFADPALGALSCYHRNLTLLSLQTESLLSMVRVASSYLDIAGMLPLRMRELARHSCNILEDLYNGGELTYRSCSAHAHIGRGDNLECINKVRAFLIEAPIARDELRCRAAG